MLAKIIDCRKDSGGVRLFQAKSHGGFETDAAVFFEWVREVGRYNPSAGWIARVVGVHPWEIALVDRKLQDEIYGNDPDTWVASPYARQGRAVRAGDGFRFSGQWQYSTGTDHCDWIVLGGIVVDESGEVTSPPEMRHFFLPRGDLDARLFSLVCYPVSVGRTTYCGARLDIPGVLIGNVK